MNGQPTLDLRTFREWFGTEALQEHPALRPFYGIGPDDDADGPAVQRIMEDASPIAHLTRDDPPVFLHYGGGDTPVDAHTSPNTWVHHPRQGIRLKAAMEALGMECHLVYAGSAPPAGGADWHAFVLDKLGAR
jgi:hypothetical protein